MYLLAGFVSAPTEGGGCREGLAYVPTEGRRRLARGSQKGGRLAGSVSAPAEGDGCRGGLASVPTEGRRRLARGSQKGGRLAGSLAVVGRIEGRVVVSLSRRPDSSRVW
ncbi:unnamed protein product [Linum trigynum]|uniref:Uncharacterized protein n=1 Tax=Linum trigynum TaxID=586398 RepID=A0AAV2DYZ1_9ROSI